ncbi:metabolite traffic protein EboE [Negadavirga shengliensis]|uniref:Metabolite traffic protein EboE n=1 Tax=Negadavirga shengliensis TaxID=1389218 RepID=A0ABV9T5U1_9BACT
MQIANVHLTYCTNIHPGESWEATFDNLKKYVPNIKKNVSPDGAFAIGLRLSDEASVGLLRGDNLGEFKRWLEEEQCYVFTFNGFPFGGFHRQVVKDEVHHPDWTTPERLAYTLRLFDILAQLLPEGMDGGISTSPLTYRHWHHGEKAIEAVKRKSCEHLLEVVQHLHKIKATTGQVLHLDIEPEPDGLLENAGEVIDFFKEWLIPLGTTVLFEQLGLPETEAAAVVKEHIRVCYDVCHFAVAYEDHGAVVAAFEREGIKTGKIQISAALKVKIPQDKKKRKDVERALLPFVESTYLHQVIGRNQEGTLTSYPDLPDALVNLADTDDGEWRIHFHVPVFVDSYGLLQSTQSDILKVLELNCSHAFTAHLEVETYTWEVLPHDMHRTLEGDISRELEWVKSKLP